MSIFHIPNIKFGMSEPGASFADFCTHLLISAHFGLRPEPGVASARAVPTPPPSHLTPPRGIPTLII